MNSSLCDVNFERRFWKRDVKLSIFKLGYLKTANKELFVINVFRFHLSVSNHLCTIPGRYRTGKDKSNKTRGLFFCTNCLRDVVNRIELCSQYPNWVCSMLSYTNFANLHLTWILESASGEGLSKLHSHKF